MWTSSYGNWGSTIVQLHHAHRTCRTARYMSSLVFRFKSMLQSPLSFLAGKALVLEVLALSLSRVSRGFHKRRHGAHTRPSHPYRPGVVAVPEHSGEPGPATDRQAWYRA